MPQAAVTHIAAAAALRAWCKQHGVKYVAAEQYPHTRMAAERANVVCPVSKILMHFPRGKEKYRNLNVYVCWRGETQEQIETTVAWLKLMRPDRPDIRVLRCLSLNEIEPMQDESFSDLLSRACDEAIAESRETIEETDKRIRDEYEAALEAMKS